MSDITNIRISPAKLSDEELFIGHKACAGCGGCVAVRLALKVLGSRSLVAVPAGCISAVSFLYPQMAFGVNAIISTFAGTASMLSGMAAGARALGLENINVVGFAGDGGTADIGIQALSGAIDRHEKIIYICYDNEGYMNTGVQKSGATPRGARTTTSPVGVQMRGSATGKKNMFEIAAANGVDYAATASIGYPDDYLNKVARAASINGTSYLHVLSPCPTGWGFSERECVKVAREAVDSGLWVLGEYYSGEYILSKEPAAFLPVKDYLSKQGRFKHLNEDDIALIKWERDEYWKKVRKAWRIKGKVDPAAWI
jgi:pyruvate ferredoxin oxidoreductase beta subunit